MFDYFNEEFDLKSKMLILWLSELFILTILRFILTRLGITEGIVRQVLIWLVASFPLIYFVYNISKFKINEYLPFLFLLLSVILIMLISIFFNPKLIKFFTREVYGIERILRPDCAIFSFLFFYMFDEPKKLKKILIMYAYIYFVYLIVIGLLPALKRGHWLDVGPKGDKIKLRYSLSFGYSMTFPTIVFLYDFIKKRKIYSVLLFIVGFLLILTKGNRGALLVVLVYIVLLVFKNLKNSKKSVIIYKLISLLVILFILYFYGYDILKFIIGKMNSIGIKSRSIEKILDGSFGNDNGRYIIWNTVINAIKTGSIFGYGMLGDRPIVYPLHYAGYSHNIFLELIASFGIIGVFIIIYLLFRIIRMLFFCKNEDWFDIYIILLSCCSQLILSMSFWYVWQFWAALAISSKYIKLKNKEYLYLS